MGQVLGSSYNRDVINQLEEGASCEGRQRLRGLVAGLQNVQHGERRLFTVSAAEAYGLYDPDLVLNVARADLLMGNRLEIGNEIVSRAGPKGAQQIYRVVQIIGDTLVLDANHPLAGQDLVFDIEIVSARDACREDFEEDFSPVATPCLH